MYELTCLLLLSVLVTAGAKQTNINIAVDLYFEQANHRARQNGATSAPLPEIPIFPNVTYSGASILGLDSSYRIGDSWLEESNNSSTVDIHFGFRLLTLVLPRLIIDGSEMSAFFRINDNYMQLEYTVHSREKCWVSLGEFRVKKLENVEIGASRPEFDGKNLDEFFKSSIPAYNQFLDYYKPELVEFMHALCESNQLPVL